MTTQISPLDDEQIRADALILPMFVNDRVADVGASARLPNGDLALLARLQQSGEIRGKEAEVTIVHRFDNERFKRIIVMGLGEKTSFTLEKLKGELYNTLKILQKKCCKVIGLFPYSLPESHIDAQAFAAIGQTLPYVHYSFSKYKELSHVEECDAMQIILLLRKQDFDRRANHEAALERGMRMGMAVVYTRELAEEPPNILTPRRLAEEAERLAERYSLDCTIIDESQMYSLGMNLALAVARGSAEPARTILLSHKGAPDSEHSVVIVGKGVTFDSGGISLKRSSHIYEMKRDMTGGAVAMATVATVAALKIPINVTAIVVTAENMPGKTAYKPGDIITAMNGKTVEIFSTDAEGRLLLADGLTYAQQHLMPSVLVDIATLTASTMRTIGPHITPYFVNRPWISALVQQAAKRSNELFWELPLHDGYTERIVSHFADIKNNATKPPATMGGALFLQEFIHPEQPWMHIDIAAVDTNDKPYRYFPTGATGISVRTVIEFLQELSYSGFHLVNTRAKMAAVK